MRPTSGQMASMNQDFIYYKNVEMCITELEVAHMITNVTDRFRKNGCPCAPYENP